MQPAVVTFYMGKEGFPFAFGFVQLLLGGLGAFSYTILGRVISVHVAGLLFLLLFVLLYLLLTQAE